MCKSLAESAVSGIKSLTVDGLDLIIKTNDGNSFTMTFPKPADGLNGIDGNSIINVQIDINNHLICTLSDNTEIDAGEIKSISGGLIQSNSENQFPEQGKEDTLYLAKDKNKLYYWDSIQNSYIATSSGESVTEALQWGSF